MTETAVYDGVRDIQSVLLSCSFSMLTDIFMAHSLEVMKHTHQVKAERTAAALSALGATMGIQEAGQRSSRQLISMQREKKLLATELSTFSLCKC